MTRPARQSCASAEGIEVASAGAAQPRPEGFAISPAAGPLPAIYVPRRPTRATSNTGLWRAIARAACLAARHLPLHHPVPGRANRGKRVFTGGVMTEFPADLRYSKDHLWARLDPQGSLVRVGVTDFAQQSLGDVVDVTLPQPGDTVKEGEPCGDIESTKSVNDLIAPLTGTVRACNGELGQSPELVNAEPYAQGWMFELEADSAELARQLAALMDASTYRQQVGE